MRKVAVAFILASTTALAGDQFELKFAGEPLDKRKAPISEAEFVASPEYNSSSMRGRVLSYSAGRLRFSEGGAWQAMWPSGEPNLTIENSSVVGALGCCFPTDEKFGNGKNVWNCVVRSKEGRVLSTDIGASGYFAEGPYNPRQKGVVHVIEGKLQSASDDIPRY